MAARAILQNAAESVAITRDLFEKNEALYQKSTG
jgi:hypothetical protein